MPQAVRTWTGVLNADWHQPFNWSPNGFPTPQDSIIIADVDTNDPILSTLAIVKTLRVNEGGHLTISSSGVLYCNGSIFYDNEGINNFGQIDNAGTINIGQANVFDKIWYFK